MDKNFRRFRRPFHELNEWNWEPKTKSLSGYEEDAFQQVILDKGTLDAIFSDEANQPLATAYLHEMHRLLRPGGRLLIVSLLQPFILRFVISWFREQTGYIVGLSQLPIPSSGTAKYVVFALTAVKLRFSTPTVCVRDERWRNLLLTNLLYFLGI